MKMLFVYGTLKRGFRLSGVLQEQRYIGTAKTTPKYGIYQYSSYPAMVDEQLAATNNLTANNAVYGELYEVTEDCLYEVDKIEGCDKGVFERKTIELDEIFLCSLPMFNETFDAIKKKNASGYLFKKALSGAANCGEFWGSK